MRVVIQLGLRANWRQFALPAGALADRLGVAWAIEVVAMLTLASGIVVIARLPEAHRRSKPRFDVEGYRSERQYLIRLHHQLGELGRCDELGVASL